MKASNGNSRIPGFTLIELLIVVAIIAILAAIAVPNFLEAQTRAKVSRAHSDIRTIALGVQCYTVDFNRQPVLTWMYTNSNSNIYRWSKYYSNETFDNGGTGIRDFALSLTTPIAYISNLRALGDPFRKQKTSQFGYSVLLVDGLLRDKNVSQGYLNNTLYTGTNKSVSGTDILNIISSRQVTLHGANGPVKPLSFMVYSVGPSMNFTDGNFITNGVYRSDNVPTVQYNYPIAASMFGYDPVNGAVSAYASHYDPTNGTKSLGMIARFE